MNCSTFHLDRFVSLKQKLVRNNNQFFMNKALRKAIMKWSKLRNKLNKRRNAKNWAGYKQQWNYCSNLLKESKHLILITSMLKKKLKTSIFGNQKTFSLQIKLNKNSNSIILTENYQIIREDDKIFVKFLILTLPMLPKASTFNK